MELGNLFFGNTSYTFEIPRHVGYEDQLRRLLDGLELRLLEPVHHTGIYYENTTFLLFPFFWGDCLCDDDINKEVSFHESSCPVLKDNFHYKPLDFRIHWYKYPFRSSYMNKELSLVEFEEVIDECIRSLYK